MKVEAQRVEAFLRDPGTARVALFHGEDVGLIRDRAARLVRTVAGSLDDPFRVVTVESEGSAGIAEEMASLPLGGGRRAVRVRDAGDAALRSVQAVLEGAVGVFSHSMLVLEAPGLSARSRLRAAVEKAAHGVAIACYPQEGRALEQTVRAILADAGVSVDADALVWLLGRLGADRGVTQSEVAKLALFAGANGTVDLEAARSCVGDLAGLSLEDALFAATAGDGVDADRALELAIAEGAAAVGVLRAGLLHLQRLQRARLEMQGGVSALEAAKTARPPVFFRRQAAFAQALSLWSPHRLGAACVRFWEAERACKRTGAPGETICRGAVLGLAQRAAAARRR